MTRKSRTPKYTLPDGICTGDLLQYYSEGWRAGIVGGVDGKGIKIQPIGTYKGSIPNTIHVSEADVRTITKE